MQALALSNSQPRNPKGTLTLTQLYEAHKQEKRIQIWNPSKENFGIDKTTTYFNSWNSAFIESKDKSEAQAREKFKEHFLALPGWTRKASLPLQRG